MNQDQSDLDPITDTDVVSEITSPDPEPTPEPEPVVEVATEASPESELAAELAADEVAPEATPEASDSSEPVEQRLATALDIMEMALNQVGTPHFKEFWEQRRLCLELFKAPVNQTVRTHLWTRYCELSREARRLKEVLDEQTAFAVEQIEIAIKALEDDLAPDSTVLSKTPEIVLQETPSTLPAEQLALYNSQQRRLGLLNAQASRIDVLREELIKTDMRVRHKNKFFERLSTIGDLVFPARKELIKQNSTLFIQDVDTFVANYFPEQQPQEELFALREEIKAWQLLAKQLTLNSHAFTHSRQALSACWDLLKVADRERKKTRSLQRTERKQNADAIIADLEKLQQQAADAGSDLDELHRLFTHLNNAVRRTDLERDDVKAFRATLDEAHKAITARDRSIQDVRDGAERQRQHERRERLSLFRDRATALINDADVDVEALTQRYQELVRDADVAAFSRVEKQQLDSAFRAIRDHIVTLKDRQMLALAGTGSADRGALNTDLQKLQTHRHQIVTQLKGLKSQAATSGFDFSRAMELNEQIQVEEERLTKVDSAIGELNAKLRHLG